MKCFKNIVMVAVILVSMPTIDAYAKDVFEDFYAHLRYLSERDKVLSQNIANSDTPKYLPKELKKNRKGDTLPIKRTNSFHMDLDESSAEFSLTDGDLLELKRNGNGVNLEHELYKKGENAMKVNEAINVYNKSKSMLNTAIMGANK